MKALAVALTMLLGAPTAAAPELREAVRYQGSLASPSEIADSSGRDNVGVIATANGGSITSRSERGNQFLHFAGQSCTPAPCPQAIIAPKDPAAFAVHREGAGPFIFGADVRLLHEASEDAGMNVFQRGTAVKGQSQWKVQVDYGHTSCRWSDGTNTVLLPHDLHDPRFKLTVGDWYSVQCLRLPFDVYSIVLYRRGWPVPVAVAVSTDVPVGAIVPTAKVLIGGKKIDPAKDDVDTDQFHGDLDEVYFRAF